MVAVITGSMPYFICTRVTAYTVPSLRALLMSCSVGAVAAPNRLTNGMNSAAPLSPN